MYLYCCWFFTAADTLPAVPCPRAQVVSAALHPPTGALLMSDGDGILRVFHITSRRLPSAPLARATTATKSNQVMFLKGVNQCTCSLWRRSAIELSHTYGGGKNNFLGHHGGLTERHFEGWVRKLCSTSLGIMRTHTRTRCVVASVVFICLYVCARLTRDCTLWGHRNASDILG